MAKHQSHWEKWCSQEKGTSLLLQPASWCENPTSPISREPGPHQGGHSIILADKGNRGEGECHTTILFVGDRARGYVAPKQMPPTGSARGESTDDNICKHPTAWDRTSYNTKSKHQMFQNSVEQIQSLLTDWYEAGLAGLADHHKSWTYNWGKKAKRQKYTVWLLEGLDVKCSSLVFWSEKGKPKLKLVHLCVPHMEGNVMPKCDVCLK